MRGCFLLSPEHVVWCSGLKCAFEQVESFVMLARVNERVVDPTLVHLAEDGREFDELCLRANEHEYQWARASHGADLRSRCPL